MKDMSLDQSRLRQSVIAAMSLALLSALAGCGGESTPTANETETVLNSDAPAPNPVHIAPVGRAELLAAVAAAADEVAGGNPLPQANVQLVDRTFELRLPFGCDAKMPSDWGEWTIDPVTRVLRISVRPEVWGDDPVINALANGADFDGAEGFWIARPWTRSEACPGSVPSGVAPGSPARSDGVAAAADGPPMRTLAIVQYFSPDAPRTLRRGSRPYSYIGKVPGNATVGAKGFRLKLSGRITAFADGQPVHCVLAAPSRPPICAAAVEFTEVALEDAETGESLADWHR